MAPPRPSSPRLVVWLTAVSFTVLAGVLGLVFVMLSWQTRDRLEQVAVHDLERSQQWFADIEERRTHQWRLQARSIAENPTLKAAVDTYATETAAGTPPLALLATIDQELAKVAATLDTNAVALVGLDGTVLSSSGPGGPDWRRGQPVDGLATVGDASGRSVVAASRLYLTTSVPLTIGPDLLGTIVAAVPLDDVYAAGLASGAGAGVVVIHGGSIVARSPGVADTLSAQRFMRPDPMSNAADGFVVRPLTTVGATAVYAVSSVTQAAEAATAGMTRVFAAAGVVALALAAVASLWLARMFSEPIERLTGSLAAMAAAGDLTAPLPQIRASRELDTLVSTFDALRTAVLDAEAESDAAYAGVIGALAAALDARDPYTAGHSQRVATLSVLIADAMARPDDERETLRLGALLHDIGKIGINDAVLRKPSRLTGEEFDHIKMHPVLGARILQPLAFLAPHIPIVELHHERPDGRGYPHGLAGDAIPLAARIVHVADAYDAMTSARAYRPALPAATALEELRAHAATDFDTAVVAAMESVWASVLAPAGGVIPVEPMPFRSPADYTAAVRSRAAIDTRTVA